jgi:hypothetical protein
MNESSVREYFNQIALAYDDGKRRYPFCYSSLKRFLKSLIPLNKLFIVFFLGVVYLAFGIFFYVWYGRGMTYISIDPEIMYISNALRFIKEGQIGYLDHPGTFSITALSLFYFPIRLFTRFSVHQNFIAWSMPNFDFLFMYSRITSLALATISMFIFLYSIHLLNKSVFAVVMSFFSFFGLPAVYFLQFGVSAEPMSFILAAIWLLFITFWLKSKKYFWLPVICFVSGLAFGNRATSAFLIPASLCFIIFDSRKLVISRMFSAFCLLGIVILGFMVSLWPVHSNIPGVINGIFDFATHSEMHLGGTFSFIDWRTVLASLNGFMDLPRSTFFILVFGWSFVAAFFARGMKDRQSVPLAAVGVVMMIGVISYAKFPLIHYQLVNFIVLIYIFSYFVNKFPSLIKFALILATFGIFVVNTEKFYTDFSSEVNRLMFLNDFVESHPSRIARVWDWSKSREFALIWVRSWGNGLYDEQMKTLVPGIFGLEPDFIHISTSFYDKKYISNICWDQMYLQRDSLAKLLTLYPKLKSSIQVIGDTGMYFVDYTNCGPTKL